jgi:hypothetical protein
MLERIKADAAETPSRVIAAQPRDVSMRRFMERDSNHQRDDPGRDSIGGAAELLKHVVVHVEKAEMQMPADTGCVKIARVNETPWPRRKATGPAAMTTSPAARCLPSIDRQGSAYSGGRESGFTPARRGGRGPPLPAAELSTAANFIDVAVAGEAAPGSLAATQLERLLRKRRFGAW